MAAIGIIPSPDDGIAKHQLTRLEIASIRFANGGDSAYVPSTWNNEAHTAIGVPLSWNGASGQYVD